MLSEGGKISQKRFISVIVSLVITAGSAWMIYKYPNLATGTLNSLLIFVCVMSGVATVAQIVALVRGVPVQEPQKENNPVEEPENGIGGGTVGNPKP